MTTVGLNNYFEAAQRNRQSAHACAALGWVVVPWKVDGGRKRPTISRWQIKSSGGLRGQEVAEHWVNNPGDIPGVVCGSDSGVWVLDIDPRNGGNASYDRLDSIGELGNTFKVKTPGGGWHLYFVWPGGEINIPNQIPLAGYPGIDIKGTGGFAVAPGAMVEIDGELKEYGVPVGVAQIASAPDWLLELVRGDGPAWISNEDHSELDGTQDADTGWLQLEFDMAASALPGEQHAALRRFVFQMRVRGLKRELALREATALCTKFQPLPGREPWTAADAESMVANTWARIAPDTVDDQLTAWASVQTPTLATAPGDAEGVVSASPLPPPRSAAVVGEPPQSIGPDDENGNELRTFAEGRVLWIAGSGIHQGWLIWNGTRWEPDQELLRHNIIRDMGLMLVRRASGEGLTESQRHHLVTRYQRLGTVGGRDACLNYSRDLFAIQAENLDSDPWALNTPGGLVDLRTGSVRPSVPDDFVTQTTKWAVREGARDEIWEQVLTERVPDPIDQAWLQRWMGYCLTGLTTEKYILAMHGPANTGKSTITEPFGRAMGTYSTAWGADTIVADSKTNKEEAMYRARGARLITVNEMKAGTRLDEGVIKGATGGDTVVGRALYQGAIEYRPQFKMWVHTNHVPSARDDALLARLLFFGMNQQLDRDARKPGIKTWLEESEEAGSAVLWWALQGLQQMQKIGLGRPQGSDDEVEEHALRSDPIRRFISENLQQVSMDLATPWEDIVVCYQVWSHNEGLKPMGTTLFGHAMKERGLERRQTPLADGRRPVCVRGWQIKMSSLSV